MSHDTTANGAQSDAKISEGLANDVERTKAQARDALRAVNETIDHIAARAKSTASTVTTRAKTAYDRATDSAERVGERVDPFVHEQPYVALGMAIAAGLLVGLLLASRRPKVVVVRARE
jgi:ElaB/YqjD/DUF883 family membrane-anchored ribosome-binding protein